MSRYEKPVVKQFKDSFTDREFDYEVKRIIKRILGFVPPNYYLEIGHGSEKVDDFMVRVSKNTYICYNEFMWGTDYLEIQDNLGFAKGTIRFIPNHIVVTEEEDRTVFSQKEENHADR